MVLYKAICLLATANRLGSQSVHELHGTSKMHRTMIYLGSKGGPGPVGIYDL